MFDSMLTVLLTVAAVGAGLMGGVYFAFSGFIMRAFDQLGPSGATKAMNAINEVILRSWFMVLFFGTTLLYAGLALVAVMDGDLANRWMLAVAGIVYVFGMFACTARFNVPLNRRLSQASDDEAQALWPRYLQHWTRWNHLRTVSSVMATSLSVGYLVSYG